jgi:hypothetical protein
MPQKTLIACPKTVFTGISYSVVLSHLENEYFISNVNILFDEVIIKKIRFTAGEIPYTKEMARNITNDFLKRLLLNKKGSKKKKEKVNKTAKHYAAMDLMDDLKL